MTFITPKGRTFEAEHNGGDSVWFYGTVDGKELGFTFDLSTREVSLNFWPRCVGVGMVPWENKVLKSVQNKIDKLIDFVPRKKRRKGMKTPTLEDLECLVMWPEGSRGYVQELAALDVLLGLCNRHGFGRLPQLAKQIEDIWQHPEKIEEYKAIQEKHMKLMTKAIEP
jgi:hypothetical protein